MKVNFLEVNQFGEDLARMQTFAKSFNHDIQPMRNGKLIALERDERVFGYADIIHLPIVFPAFHPAITNPRSVVETFKGWRAMCQLSHGGEGIIAIPLDHDRKTFPTEMLEGLGYKKMNRELYSL
jgi:hypothetical protein